MNTVVNKMREVTAKIDASLNQVDTDWEAKVEEHNELIEKINQDVEAFEVERDGYLVTLHVDFGFASRKELIKALRGIDKTLKEVTAPTEETPDAPDSETSDQEEVNTESPL